MRYDKFNKIVRLSYLLPYNAISPTALELAIPADDDSYLDYSPTKSMAERLASCDRGHHNRLCAIKVMEKYGYIEIVRRKVGPGPKDYVKVARLTKSGLYYLTAKEDHTLERERIENAGMANQVHAPVSYLPDDDDDMMLRFTLNKLSDNTDDNPDASEQFAALVEEAILDGRLSILATELGVAQDIQLTGSTKVDTLYRNWRLANVQALFKTNQFLTNIDRVPIPCANPLLDIHDPENRGLVGVEDLTRYALRNWYGSHIDSFTFHDPFEDHTDNAYEKWVNTPVFYPVSEIPGFEVEKAETASENYKQNNSTYTRTFIGLAAGVRTNYLVYYAKTKPNNWNVKSEDASIKKVEEALAKAYEWVEHPHNGKNCNYGIFVCHSVYHFKALFTSAKKRMRSKTGVMRNVSAPFNTISIVPLNHAGCMQVRMLMEYGPQDLENILMYNYIERYENFRENAYDNTYKLTYNNVPVLLAHTMDYQKLFDAMEDYERGVKFYVSCFPQQVKFIRQIMPNVEFL